MVPLPERFDANEWFALLSTALVWTIALLQPKRFTAPLLAVTVVFIVYVSQTVDSLIAVKPFDLYDVNDTSKFEVTDVFLYYLNYPVVTYLFLYFYEKWQMTGMKLVFYIIGSAALSTILEYVSDWFHVFTYKGWSIWYSPFIYAFVYTVFVMMHQKFRSLLSQDNKARQT